MEKIKNIPQLTIRKIRRAPSDSGLHFKMFGRSTELSEYSDREITEMIYGIYKDKKIVAVDNGYFIDLNDVIEAVCALDKVSYFKKPTKEDLKTNRHNSIKNIRTFYIKDYLLVTKSKVNGTTKHSIANLLCKIGAINKGRKKFVGLYSTANHYQTLQAFGEGSVPKDLFHPIKRHINGLFFNDDYRISKFRVESKLKIDK